MPSISVTGYDCSTNTVSGQISGAPPFPTKVCAYAYKNPASSIPACPPPEAKCLAWSAADQGSGTFEIPDVPREQDNVEYEVVVWAVWCENASAVFDCSGGGTTTTTTSTTSTTTTSTTTSTTTTSAPPPPP